MIDNINEHSRPRLISFGQIDAAKYKQIALDSIFLKYISGTFAARCAALTRRFASEDAAYFPPGCDEALPVDELEDRDYYREVNVFWVPETTRSETLRSSAKQSLALFSSPPCSQTTVYSYLKCCASYFKGITNKRLLFPVVARGMERGGR